MVLASDTPIGTLTHNRQRDQQTEAPEERKDQINQQRHSLAQALEAVNTWNRRDSVKDSTTRLNKTAHPPSNAPRSNDVQNAGSSKSQSIHPPLDNNKSKSVTNYFYKGS